MAKNYASFGEHIDKYLKAREIELFGKEYWLGKGGNRAHIKFADEQLTRDALKTPPSGEQITPTCRERFIQREAQSLLTAAEEDTKLSHIEHTDYVALKKQAELFAQKYGWKVREQIEIWDLQHQSIVIDVIDFLQVRQSVKIPF